MRLILVEHKVHDIKYQISASLNNQISGSLVKYLTVSVNLLSLGPEGSDSALLEEY